MLLAWRHAVIQSKLSRLTDAPKRHGCPDRVAADTLIDRGRFPLAMFAALPTASMDRRAKHHEQKSSDKSGLHPLSPLFLVPTCVIVSTASALGKEARRPQLIADRRRGNIANGRRSSSDCDALE
jgi:hypothetical protein